MLKVVRLLSQASNSVYNVGFGIYSGLYNVISMSWWCSCWHVGLNIRRSPVQVPLKTDFSIMLKLPVKSVESETAPESTLKQSINRYQIIYFTLMSTVALLRKQPVKYLLFHKRGRFLVWRLMLSQRGPNHVFLFFLSQYYFFSCQRGPWPNGPFTYTTGHSYLKKSYTMLNIFLWHMPDEVQYGSVKCLSLSAPRAHYFIPLSIWNSAPWVHSMTDIWLSRTVWLQTALIQF